jgi:acetyltransferase-like isoleucine patch superfamily enzyme
MRPHAKKFAISAPLVFWNRRMASLLEFSRRIRAFAALRAAITHPLPGSTVILGRAQIYGTGRIRCGERLLIYPNQYWETVGEGEIVLGDNVVLSSGVHLVAYHGIFIGKGTMIGEYTSIRDANHTREAGKPIRDSGHTARPIFIGEEVWIGRGAAILSGVSIGDGATVGANAVVTRDVPAGAVVAGVPAVPIRGKSRAALETSS